MADFVLTNDSRRNTVSSNLIKTGKLQVNNSLQVNTISPLSGGTLTINGSLNIGGDISLTDITVDTLASNSSGTIVVNASLCVNGSLAVDVISSKSGTVTVNDSLLVDSLASATGSTLTVNDSFVLGPGAALSVDRTSAAAIAGTTALVAGDATVTTSAVSATSSILVGYQAVSGTLTAVKLQVFTITPGTSFRVLSIDASGNIDTNDTSTFSWLILN